MLATIAAVDNTLVREEQYHSPLVINEGIAWVLSIA